MGFGGGVRLLVLRRFSSGAPSHVWGGVEAGDVSVLAQLDKLHFKVSIYIFLILWGE